MITKELDTFPDLAKGGLATKHVAHLKNYAQTQTLSLIKEGAALVARKLRGQGWSRLRQVEEETWSVTSKEIAETMKPKTLFLLADDLNDGVGHLKGHPRTQMPPMDRLLSLVSVYHCQPILRELACTEGSAVLV